VLATTWLLIAGPFAEPWLSIPPGDEATSDPTASQQVFGLGIVLAGPFPDQPIQWVKRPLVPHTAARQLRRLTGFPDPPTR
jgi:hypothetical protein